MSDLVKIIECPRDAWQALPVHIAPQAKAAYLRMLIEAGFTHIDAVSFVSPGAVPQMADSEEVLAYLMPPVRVEIIGIVVNEKGAHRAIATGAVQTLGFPFSISPEFLYRNQNQSPVEAINALEAIRKLARGAGMNVIAYVSMAFGNPYGEPWNVEEVLHACDVLIEAGVRQISLADTVGLASPAQIADATGAALIHNLEVEIGVHLHARPGEAASRIRAAFDVGCRRFDSAIGGLGGCPFAQDALVGNIPTETLVSTLTECGAKMPRLHSLDAVLQANAEVAKEHRTLTV
jgi:hydroxymethylglutaryl-CoA lyase